MKQLFTSKFKFSFSKYMVQLFYLLRPFIVTLCFSYKFTGHEYVAIVKRDTKLYPGDGEPSCCILNYVMRSSAVFCTNFKKLKKKPFGSCSRFKINFVINAFSRNLEKLFKLYVIINM